MVSDPSWRSHATHGQGLTPATAATRLTYDGTAGTLSYDADGNGAGAPILIARLTPGLALTADDFVVV